MMQDWVASLDSGMEPSGSRVVTCFNAANHKRVTMMMVGRIVLFKMRHVLLKMRLNGGMKYVSTMAIRQSLATVTRATHSVPLEIQMTDTVSCLAAAKNKQMIQVARNVLAISPPVNLLLRLARV